MGKRVNIAGTAEDALHRANGFLLAARQAGKPLRVFCGFASGTAHHLHATTDAHYLVKSLPRIEVRVAPDDLAEAVAARLHEAWAALRQSTGPAPRPRPPARGHAWRRDARKGGGA